MRSCCAQRLAASQRSARRSCRDRLRSPVDVLNALRHHRGWHESRIARPSADEHVLNALRHHRGWHAGDRDASIRARSRAQRLAASQRLAPQSPARSWRDRTMCSTPCGITEVGTRRLTSWTWPGIVVLNALRHHRGWHVREADGPAGRSVACSTPCGITEVGTRLRMPAMAVDLCSTPCGITEVGGTAARASRCRSSTVLNALRHHRGRRRPRGVGGGQKLSHYRGQIEPPASLPSELFGSQLFGGPCPSGSHGMIMCTYEHYRM